MKKILLLLFLSQTLLSCANSDLSKFTANMAMGSSLGNGASLGSGNGALQVAWTSVLNQQTGFKIEVSADGINFILKQTVLDGINSAIIPGLVVGQNYFVRIKAYSEAGDSLPTTAIQIKAQ
jgi:hypothetical protein